MKIFTYNTKLPEDTQLVEIERMGMSLSHQKGSYIDQNVMRTDEEGISQNGAMPHFIADAKALLKSSSKSGCKQQDDNEEKKVCGSDHFDQGSRGEEVRQNSPIEILGTSKSLLSEQLDDMKSLAGSLEGMNNEDQRRGVLNTAHQRVLGFISQVEEASSEENFELRSEKHHFESKEESKVIGNLMKTKFSLYTFLKTSKLNKIDKGNQGQLVFRYSKDVVKIYTQNEVEAFEREKRVYFEISHKIPYYTIKEAEQSIYILVTEAGIGDLDDLSQHIKQEKQQLSEQLLLWMTASLLESLNQLFMTGFCHRDIKPQNIIMISESLRLIDFGLAASIQPVDKSLRWAGTPKYTDPYLREKRTGYSEAELMLGDCYSTGWTILEFVITSLRPALDSEAQSIEDLLLALNTDYPFLAEILKVLLFPDKAQLQRSEEIIRCIQNIVSKIEAQMNRKQLFRYYAEKIVSKTIKNMPDLFSSFKDYMDLKNKVGTVVDDNYCEVHEEKVEQWPVADEGALRDFFEPCSKGYCLSRKKTDALHKQMKNYHSTNARSSLFGRITIDSSCDASTIIDLYKVPRRLIDFNNEGCRQDIFNKSTRKGYEQLTEAYRLIHGRTLLKRYFDNHIRNNVHSYCRNCFDLVSHRLDGDVRSIYHLNYLGLVDFDLESIIINNFYIIQARYIVDQLARNGNSDILSELKRFAAGCPIISKGHNLIRMPTDIMIQLSLIEFVSIIVKFDVEVLGDSEFTELVKKCKSLHQQRLTLKTRFEDADTWVWFGLAFSMFHLVKYLKGFERTLDDQHDFFLQALRSIPDFAQDTEILIHTKLCNYTAFSNAIYNLYIKENSLLKTNNPIQLPSHLVMSEEIYCQLDKIKLSGILTSNGFDRHSLTFSHITFRPRNKTADGVWHILNEITKLQGLSEIDIDLKGWEMPEHCSQGLETNLSSLALRKLLLRSDNHLKGECMNLLERVVASVKSINVFKLLLSKSWINEETVKRLEAFLQNLRSLQIVKLDFDTCPKITNNLLIQLVRSVLDRSTVKSVKLSTVDCRLLSQDVLLDAERTWKLLYPSKTIEFTWEMSFIREASSYFSSNDE